MSASKTIKSYTCACGATFLAAPTYRGGKKPSEHLAEWLVEHQPHEVWAEWNALPDDHPTPVRTIAAKLGLSNAEVAAIVYPVPQFSVWQEEDERPDWSVFGLIDKEEGS